MRFDVAMVTLNILQPFDTLCFWFGLICQSLFFQFLLLPDLGSSLCIVPRENLSLAANQSVFYCYFYSIFVSLVGDGRRGIPFVF